MKNIDEKLKAVSDLRSLGWTETDLSAVMGAKTVSVLDSISKLRHCHTEVLETAVTNLPLSKRTITALTNDGLTTLRDILNRSPAELYRIPGVGRFAVEEINSVLDTHGILLAHREAHHGPDRPKAPII